MPQTLNAREALYSEAPALARLHAASFPDNRWDEHIWQRYIHAERSLVLVAGEESGVVAGLVAQHLFEEAEILTMMVAEDMRRRGMASMLLEAALQRLQREGVERVFLEVRESNRAAQALYAAAGFMVAGRRHGYYPATEGREDAVLMRRNLP